MSSATIDAGLVLMARGLDYAYPGGAGGGSFRLDVPALDVREGEVLALCGPSGSGKSTLLAILAGLLRPASGHVLMATDEGAIDLHGGTRGEWRRHRRHIGFVHQDPREYLNDRRIVADIVADPLQIHRLPGNPGAAEATRGARSSAEALGLGARRSARERRERALAMLRRVGIGPELADRDPGALSGGQRQRVALARALVARPRLVFLDEPTSALDVSVQAAIVELIRELRRDDGRTAYVLVTHDLPLARQLADRVAILDQGRVIEVGDIDRVFRAPAMPMTQRLLGIARADLGSFGAAPRGVEGRPQGRDEVVESFPP